MPKVKIDRLRVRLPGPAPDLAALGRAVERALGAHLPKTPAGRRAGAAVTARIAGALAARSGR